MFCEPLSFITIADAPIVGRRAALVRSFQDIVGLRKKSLNESGWEWEKIKVATNIFLSANKFLTEKKIFKQEIKWMKTKED